jgi:hypothetical protein
MKVHASYYCRVKECQKPVCGKCVLCDEHSLLFLVVPMILLRKTVFLETKNFTTLVRKKLEIIFLS